MKKRGIFVLILLSLLLFLNTVYSHGDEPESSQVSDLTSYSIKLIIAASIITALLVLLAVFHKNLTERLKWLIFITMFIVTLAVTFYVAGSTIYLNVVSESQGPVHWHADYEVWNCGQKLELVDPEGFSNRIGNPVFHEHNDNRIHVEGVLVKLQQADLASFFEVIGGELTTNHLGILTENGYVNADNGDSCNGQPGKLQVFVYKVTNPLLTKNWEYEQIKIDNYGEYILSPYGNVPPGDCIIVEFSEEKEKTEHICSTYRLAMQRGELSGS